MRTSSYSPAAAGGGTIRISNRSSSLNASAHARAIPSYYSATTDSEPNLVCMKVDYAQAFWFDDIESGVAVATYCARVVEPIAACLEVSLQRSLEERLISFLRERPGSDKRALYRKLHVSVTELERVLEPLVRSKIVREEKGRFYLCE